MIHATNIFGDGVLYMEGYARQRIDPEKVLATASPLKNIPSDWGPTYENRGLGAALTRTGSNTIKFHTPAHLAIVMLTPQPIREIALNKGRIRRFLAPVGSIDIIPASTDLFSSWSVPKTSLTMAINPDALSEIAGGEFDQVNYELHPPRAGLVDEKAKILAEMICCEIDSKTPNKLYLDSLNFAFSMHILRKYSSIERTSTFFHRGGLTTKAWRDVNEYIHEHLQSDLSIAQLARVAHLSQSHFLRAFRKTVGQSPHRYVLECRLHLAEQLIVTTNKSLSEIARHVGFSSHSHLAASMRRYRDTAPSELRQATTIDIGSPQNSIRQFYD